MILGSDCRKCPLWEGALSVCIGGRGNTHAKYLVVGQNPGREEDMAGAPFIGRSGKLLIGLFQEAGFEGHELRFTNAVRCLTPGNRTPETEEINACREYLADELRDVSPLAVIALGDVALRALCRLSGISQRRGTSMPLHSDFGLPKLEVWPTYHPAFILRSPNYRQVVIDDLRRVRNSFNAPQKIEWQEWPVIGDVVAWDVETNFNYEKKTGGDNVTQSACSWRNKQGVVQTLVSTHAPFTYPVEFSRANRPTILVTHNGWEFDLPKCGYEAQGRDTMCLAWLDDESQPKSLEALAARYCGAVSWKSARTAELGSEEYKEYNARDAYWTLRVYEELIKRLGDRVKIADLIILPAFRALKGCTRRGIYIDQAEVSRFTEKFSKEKDESLTLLRQLTGSEKFNPNSSKQVVEWLCTHGCLIASSSAEELEKHDRVPEDFKKAIVQYRHAGKMLGTYLKPLEGKERIHPEYYMFPRIMPGKSDKGGTASGRLTASDNALTLPREMKTLYGAPKGKMLVTADYNSLEFRLGVWFAGAKAALGNYQRDPLWDPHGWFARPFYGLPPDAPVTKEQRQIAKSANFSQVFGGYWKTMQNYALGYSLNLSEETCQKAHLLFHTLLPEIKPWWAWNLAFVKEHGYIETPTGRRRHFGRWEDIPYAMRGDVEREATNLLTQSFGHDITLLALAQCHQEGIPVVLEWHDAIWAEIDEFQDDAQKAQFEALVEDCMVRRPLATLEREFGVRVTVPLTIEISYRKGS